VGRRERARTLTIEERRAEVARLAKMAWTETRIAAELGCSQPTVCRDLKMILAELAENRIEDAAQARELAREKLSTAEAACMSILVHSEEGDPELALKATDRLVKIQERLARMYGIDAPERVENTISGGSELTPEAIASATARVFGELAHAGTGDDARNGRLSADGQPDGDPGEPPPEQDSNPAA
jgi:hypothetical protein